MKKIKSFVICLLFIILVTPLIQYHIEFFGYFGISAVFINDTASYWSNLIKYSKGLDRNYFTLIGVLILYYPAIYFSWLYCLIVNSVLLILSGIYFLKTIVLLNLNIPSRKYHGIFIIVLFNFYLWGILYFPNKEIPLIFLTNLLIYNLTKNDKNIFSLYPIVLVFFFRDGYAFILLLSVFILWFFQKRFSKSPVKYLFFLVLFLMFFSLKDLAKLDILSNFQYVIDRNIDYEVDTKFASNLPYYFSYLINLFNNSIVYALRAQMLDTENRLYFHGIGIWQFAVVLSIGLFFWIKILNLNSFNNNKIFQISLLILLSYLFLSTSTYPQVRYMMPFIFWLVASIFMFLDFKSLVIIYYCFFILAILIIVLGLSHKSGIGVDIDDFSKKIFFN